MNNLSKFRLDKEIIEEWITRYYFGKGFGDLYRESFNSFNRFSALILIGTLSFLLYSAIIIYIKPSPIISWLIWGVYMVLIWITVYIWGKQQKRLFGNRVLSPESIETKIKEAMDSLSNLNYKDCQQVLRLINLSKAGSVESFTEELKQAINNYPNLAKWIFIQEICHDIDLNCNKS